MDIGKTSDVKVRNDVHGHNWLAWVGYLGVLGVALNWI